MFDCKSVCVFERVRVSKYDCEIIRVRTFGYELTHKRVMCGNTTPAIIGASMDAGPHVCVDVSRAAVQQQLCIIGHQRERENWQRGLQSQVAVPRTRVEIMAQ